MPLNKDAEKLIRRNLEEISKGRKVRSEIVGEFTEEQLRQINEFRAGEELPPLNGKIFFIGRHVYKSRIIKHGYTIDDVVEQIVSGMSEDSTVLLSPTRTALENQTPRADRYGNNVTDRVTFECHSQNPLAELLSAIPVGDVVRPGDAEKKQKAAKSRPSTTKDLTDSPG